MPDALSTGTITTMHIPSTAPDPAHGLKVPGPPITREEKHQPKQTFRFPQALPTHPNSWN